MAGMKPLMVLRGLLLGIVCLLVISMVAPLLKRNPDENRYE
jgi:hypothetical protein